MQLDIVGSGSNGNTYLLHDENSCLILDCGITLKIVKKMLQFKINHIKGVLCSHLHLDHSKYIQNYLDMGIKVYMPYSVKEIYYNEPYAIYIKPQKPVQIGEYKIIPFLLPHDGIENYGFYIEGSSFGGLLYMTDLQYSPYIFKSQRIEHFLIECNYIEDMVDYSQENYSHRLQGHASLDTCKGIITANKTTALRTITLCHLSDTSSDRKRILSEVKEVAGSRVKVQIASPEMEPVPLNLCPF